MTEREIVNIEYFDTQDGGQVPIVLYETEAGGGRLYSVEVNGLEWFEIDSNMHAVVLFHLMLEHLPEYIHY